MPRLITQLVGELGGARRCPALLVEPLGCMLL